MLIIVVAKRVLIILGGWKTKDHDLKQKRKGLTKAWLYIFSLILLKSFIFNGEAKLMPQYLPFKSGGLTNTIFDWFVGI